MPQVYGFALLQLQPKDEMVFKSLVRTLENKTRHAWRCVDAREADVLVLGPDAPTPDIAHARVVVRAGNGPGDQLALPLRVTQVWMELDRASEMLQTRRA